MRSFLGDGTWARRLACCVAVGLLLGPSLTSADEITSEPLEEEDGYEAIEEVAYELFVEAGQDYAATLRIRVALHNASQSTRDVIHTLALPATAELEALAVAEGGRWSAGEATTLRESTGRRDPGTVYVRAIEPKHASDIPAAQIVAFSVNAGATIQVEVVARVHPRLRGDRWELDLAARCVDCLGLAPERRTTVEGLEPGDDFYLDDAGHEAKTLASSRPQDMVTLGWPAHLRRRAALDGRYEVIPSASAVDEGEVRLYLQLGLTQTSVPDHVIVAIDRSFSTPENLSRAAVSFLGSLFQGLPPATTFDALAFDRKVTPLCDGLDRRPLVTDAEAMRTVAAALNQRSRGQGTDLAFVLAEAARRARSEGLSRKRTLVIVITDGMFPSRVTPLEIETAFEREVGSLRPEVLFVVDEPMFAGAGLPPDHPVVRVATKLGARISTATLAQLDSTTSRGVLAAPQTLGDLRLELPKNLTLLDEVPTGLVAGSFLVLRGRYEGKRPRSIRISGRSAGKHLSQRIAATTMPSQPAALVARTSGELDGAAEEGFARPPWYRPSEEAKAEQAIVRAGRVGRSRHGHLDHEIFRHYLMTRVYPRARACYNRALVRTRDQAGRIALEIEVGKGEVMLARIEEIQLVHPDANLAECVTEAAWALDIPAGELDQQIYRIRYPLRFVAPAQGYPSGRVERISDDVMELLLGPAGEPRAPAEVGIEAVP